LKLGKSKPEVSALDASNLMVFRSGLLR